MLELETKTFEDNLPALIQSDLGKYVLIKDDKIIGTFIAIEDALNCGYERFKDKPFLVKQILSFQQPLNFVNNHLFV